MPERPEREARRAQAAYLGQARKVIDAVRRLAELNVVLLDGEGNLTARRRDYDDVGRHMAAPETWPHA